MSWDEIARREKAKQDRAAKRAQEEAERIESEKHRARWMAEMQAKRDEEERQRWLPKSLRVVNRGLLDVLIHCSHRRAKNWVAIVAVDPVMPGGLSRVFFDRARAKGPAKYIVPERLEVGNVLEFGADYVQGTGKVEPNRVFAMVTLVTADHIEVKPYKTYEEALDHKFLRVG